MPPTPTPVISRPVVTLGAKGGLGANLSGLLVRGGITLLAHAGGGLRSGRRVRRRLPRSSCGRGLLLLLLGVLLRILRVILLVRGLLLRGVLLRLSSGLLGGGRLGGSRLGGSRLGGSRLGGLKAAGPQLRHSKRNSPLNHCEEQTNNDIGSIKGCLPG